MLLDYIFPRRCPLCEEIITNNKLLTCEKCSEKDFFINGPRCKKCGKEISLAEKEYCYDCEKRSHKFEMGVSAFRHTKEVKNSIYRFKYSNKREYKDFFCDSIIKRTGKIIKSWDADVLIPVPLHKSKLIMRGYNQSEVLSKILSNKLGIPCNTSILIRDKKTVPQKELSTVQRKKNLENAFKINCDIVQYKKIILVDDIYTTGNTIDACSEVLRKKGAEKVYFITLSVGEGI